jgi:hypothetical protein
VVEVREAVARRGHRTYAGVAERPIERSSERRRDRIAERARSSTRSSVKADVAEPEVREVRNSSPARMGASEVASVGPP